jgi:hypothetical protein
MAIGSRVSGDFKSASGLFAKVNGGWKKAQFGYVKVAGEWKQFWADKLEDDFGRANTQSGLGTALSGQAWTVLRSLWQIKDNAANTTGTKTDYPLASVDLGLLDFELEANELTPGTGVAIRVTDANNWWGVVPFYNQTSQTYTYCAQSQTVTYCIANCPEVAGYYLRCDPPNSETVEPIFDYDCVPNGYEFDISYGYDVVGFDCPPAYYVPGTFSLERQCDYVYVGGREVVRLVCTEVLVQTEGEWVYPECTPIYDYTEIYTEVCNGSVQLVQVGTESSCLPDGYTNVEQYDCCQFGQYEQCIQTATGTTFTNYFYLQVVKMENGVFSVVGSTEVPARWSALKVTGNANTLTATAYTDSLYSNAIGTFTTTAFLAPGTGYGVVSRPSNFEDGRTIGSLKVKAIGQ